MSGRQFRRFPFRSGDASARPGFSLLEVVVATLLLSLTAVALASYSAVTLQNVFRSNQLAAATMVAREKIDSLRTQPFDSLRIERSISNRALGRYTFVVITEVSLKSPRLKTFTVSVADPRGKEIQQFGNSVFMSSGR